MAWCHLVAGLLAKNKFSRFGIEEIRAIVDTFFSSTKQSVSQSE